MRAYGTRKYWREKSLGGIWSFVCWARLNCAHTLLDAGCGTTSTRAGRTPIGRHEGGALATPPAPHRTTRTGFWRGKSKRNNLHAHRLRRRGAGHHEEVQAYPQRWGGLRGTPAPPAALRAGSGAPRPPAAVKAGFPPRDRFLAQPSLSTCFNLGPRVAETARAPAVLPLACGTQRPPAPG